MRTEMALLLCQARTLRDNKKEITSETLLEGLSKKWLQWADGEYIQMLIDWVIAIVTQKPEVLDNPTKILMYRESTTKVMTLDGEQAPAYSEGDMYFQLETPKLTDNFIRHYLDNDIVIEIPAPNGEKHEAN